MPSQEIFEFVLNTNFSNITRKKRINTIQTRNFLYFTIRAKKNIRMNEFLK